MTLGVLILGQREDAHVEAVSANLLREGADVLVFDQFRDQAAIEYGPEGARWPFAAWLERQEGVAIWPRVKAPLGEVREEFQDSLPPADAPVGPYQTKEYYRAEWRVFTRALVQGLPTRHPHVALINPGVLFDGAGVKPLQLDAAAGVGLTIPHTVIGNAEAAIGRAFGDELLFKPLGSNLVGGIGLPPPAMLAKAEVLAESRATVCPAIFQDRVEKARELRIHVAGEAITVVEIDSQSMDRSRLDWRAAQLHREIYSHGALPPELDAPLRAFMARMRLDIGAFDFAVRPDGRCVFFECNPEGQWLWLERILGIPISRDVADVLLARAAEAASRRPSSRASRNSRRPLSGVAAYAPTNPW